MNLSDKEELAAEIKKLVEEHAGESGSNFGVKVLDLSAEIEGDTQAYSVRIIGEGDGALHEVQLQELHEQLKHMEGPGKHGEGHGGTAHGLSQLHKIKGLEHLGVMSGVGGSGHGAELDDWFSEWDIILEDLAIDLSAAQLDRIQTQLDQAREYMDQMGGMHGAYGLGMTLTPGGPHGEKPNIHWFGEDGEISLDLEELMEEIEVIVKESVEAAEEAKKAESASGKN